MVLVGADALIGPLPNVSWPKNATFHCRGDEGIAPYDGKKNAFLTAADTSGEVSLRVWPIRVCGTDPAVAIGRGMWYHIQKGEREDLFMKRILCIILSILMLLSLAACGEPEPDPEQLAFEAACALLEEGKYQEAIDAFSRLESYRKVQEKIDEAEAALEAQWLASEKAARQAELEKLGFLYGTTWHELGGTAELTFEEHQNGGSLAHYRYWDDWRSLNDFDTHWVFIDGGIWINYLPDLDYDASGEYGYRATAEERDGVTHLLVGDLDFVRSEDYGPYAPVEIEITLDNWQEYFEVHDVPYWQYDDFGVRDSVEYCTVLQVKEPYQDRVVLRSSNVTFGYTYDAVLMSVAKFDPENAIFIPGVITWLANPDESETFNINASYDSYPFGTYDTENPFPLPYCVATLYTSYIPEATDFFFHNDLKIDRVAGTLVLRAE